MDADKHEQYTCDHREYYLDPKEHWWEMQYWNRFSQAQKIQEQIDTYSQMLGPVSQDSGLWYSGETENGPTPTFVISDLLFKKFSAEKNNWTTNVEDPLVCA